MSNRQKQILFFADRLPPLTGGVEMHARYFIEHFSRHPLYPLAGIITKNSQMQDCVVTSTGQHACDFEQFSPNIVFFNSGRWIEELPHIRAQFPRAVFIYRTGGNEILQASLSHRNIPLYSERQKFWAQSINSTIDILITNSAYTEQRLREIGIKCRFERFVGGVNVARIKQLTPRVVSQQTCHLFCAARFVPYKNHALLLSVVKELIQRGHSLQLRLAGDGPLLNAAKEQVEREQLDHIVFFLGAIDNESALKEIAQSSVYIQLSSDYVTQVPGGSYIHAEGMGRSLLEAISAGTYVIAGRSGALDEIITEGRGYLVSMGTAHQMADVIDPIMQNLPNKLEVTDMYCWSKIFKKYEELFAGMN